MSIHTMSISTPASDVATHALEEATYTVIRRTWLRPGQAEAKEIRAQLLADPDFEQVCSPFLAAAQQQHPPSVALPSKTASKASLARDEDQLDRVINECQRRLVGSEGGVTGPSEHWNKWHQLYLDDEDEGVRDGHYDDYGRMI